MPVPSEPTPRDAVDRPEFAPPAPTDPNAAPAYASRPAGPPVRRAVLAAIVAGLLVLALRLWLKWAGPLPGDEWALHHLDTTTLPSELTDVGNFFSVIGTPIVASLTVAVALPFVLRSDGVRGVAFVLLAGTGVFFNMLLKVISGPTPLMVEHTTIVGALNYPSGHTVYGVVFFGALARLAWRRRRYDVAAPLVALLALMGPFRVIIEAHFVSDVVAGYLVGFAWLVVAATVTRVHAPRHLP